MNIVKQIVARIRAYIAAQEEAARRKAEVPYEVRYADEIAAWKVVRNALLVR